MGDKVPKPTTDIYRRQHDDLLRIAQKIREAIESNVLGRINADEVSKSISQLNSSLLLHLTLEDSALYPNLERHTDASVRSMAHSYKKSMGGLRASYEAYARKWISVADIEKNQVQFSTETIKILKELGDRISKENNELLALVDRLGSQPGGLPPEL
jgi:hypothetical protein